MFNLQKPVRYAKSDPSTYVIQYRNGRVIRRGRGLAFFYFVPNSTLVAVPMASVDVPFMFAESSADFQEITLQGRVVYRIAQPESLAEMANFALRPDGQGYASDDPGKLNDRVLHQVQVSVRAELQALPLAEALTAGSRLTDAVKARLRASESLAELGIEPTDLAILAVKPKPETARALEAERREQILQDADEAIYRRRNAAVEQERGIKENELQTEISVAEKNREVKEAEKEAERSVAQKQRAIDQENLEGRIERENRRRTLVEAAAENSRQESEAKAYAIGAVMDAMSRVDPKVLEAVASTGMASEQLIARAFQGIAERAEKIGELNVSPDLLGRLLGRG